MRSFLRSFGLTLPDSPISAVSASPGMTRMSPKTISDESRSTGTESSSRRITYLCMAAPARPPTRRSPPGPPLLVEPHPGDGRRPVGIRPSDGQRGAVSHVGLEDEEAGVVRHPHAQDL